MLEVVKTASRTGLGNLALVARGDGAFGAVPVKLASTQGSPSFEVHVDREGFLVRTWSMDVSQHRAGPRSERRLAGKGEEGPWDLDALADVVTIHRKSEGTILQAWVSVAEGIEVETLIRTLAALGGPACTHRGGGCMVGELSLADAPYEPPPEEEAPPPE